MLRVCCGAGGGWMVPTAGAMQVGRVEEIGTATRISVVVGTGSAVEIGRAVWISMAVATGMAARLGATMLVGAVVPLGRSAPLCLMHPAGHLQVRRRLREHFLRWGFARPRIFRPMDALYRFSRRRLPLCWMFLLTRCSKLTQLRRRTFAPGAHHGTERPLKIRDLLLCTNGPH